jgi:hypothetical protein
VKHSLGFQAAQCDYRIQCRIADSLCEASNNFFSTKMGQRQLNMP